ncbi:hypothetical protein BC936DRAFT_149733 [Jimgerdemannia flammicorona]|uniref:Kinesin light chain n=1 Tax=Jimgerdemannia flammicorona TaxID=994334 RepID=A0A433DJU8_9FUNG|nr:hypothetical protein BC936DRAFT_149733 [Jimgerdemannia flammicorona]
MSNSYLSHPPDLAKLAVSSSELVNGRKHPDTATALSNLSYLYASQQNFQDAKTHTTSIVEIREQLFGLRHANQKARNPDPARHYLNCTTVVADLFSRPSRIATTRTTTIAPPPAAPETHCAGSLVSCQTPDYRMSSESNGRHKIAEAFADRA